MVIVVTSGGITSHAARCIHCAFSKDTCFAMATAPPAKKRKGARLRKLAKHQDQEVMAGLEGGRVQPASGSIDGYKSDGRVYASHRIETKFTFAQTFYLERADLDKVRSECWGLERPVLIVDFKDEASGRTEDRWAVIPHKDWERYANAATSEERADEATDES